MRQGVRDSDVSASRKAQCGRRCERKWDEGGDETHTEEKSHRSSAGKKGSEHDETDDTASEGEIKKICIQRRAKHEPVVAIT